MRFVIRTDEPFRGHCQSVLLDDNTVAWTDGLTVEQYQEARGFPVRIIEESEMKQLEHAYVASLTTRPVRETLEQYNYALDVLPPSRWQEIVGFSVFHICERITADLVSWHARKGDLCLTWNDRASLPRELIETKLWGALYDAEKEES